MRKFNYILPVVFLLMTLLSSVDLFAACTFPGGCCPAGFPPQFCPDCPPCVPVPLDGGLGALLLAGVAYGAKKFHGRLK